MSYSRKLFFCVFSLLGQVLSYENVRDIIKFCKEERLVLLADEVGMPRNFHFTTLSVSYRDAPLSGDSKPGDIFFCANSLY